MGQWNHSKLTFRRFWHINFFYRQFFWHLYFREEFGTTLYISLCLDFFMRVVLVIYFRYNFFSIFFGTIYSTSCYYNFFSKWRRRDISTECGNFKTFVFFFSLKAIFFSRSARLHETKYIVFFRLLTFLETAL